MVAASPLAFPVRPLPLGTQHGKHRATLPHPIAPRKKSRRFKAACCWTGSRNNRANLAHPPSALCPRLSPSAGKPGRAGRGERKCGSLPKGVFPFLRSERPCAFSRFRRTYRGGISQRLSSSQISRVVWICRHWTDIQSLGRRRVGGSLRRLSSNQRSRGGDASWTNRLINCSSRRF
jgi:hypothetical protein